MTLSEWAALRAADLAAREFGHSFRVGPTKPMGSQRFFARGAPGGAELLRLLRMLLPLLPAILFRRVLIGRVTRSDDPAVLVYVIHREAFESLRRRHRAIFAEAGWPWPIEAFLVALATRAAPPGTRLFDAIADLYGDRLSPGRTDVLPSVPRGRLLAAARAYTGAEDPAAVFFLPPPAEAPAEPPEGAPEGAPEET